jgi:hypothetical protein
MSRYSFLFIGIMMLIFAGCSSKYPMGLSEQEWMQLSIQEKTDLTLKQESIEKEKRKERIKKYEIDKKIELEKQKAQAKRLEKLYQEAEYGDIVNINLYGGKIESSNELLTLIPTAITIVRGESKTVPIVLKKKHYTYTKQLWIALNPMGNKIILSLKKPTKYNIEEQIVILNNGKWYKEQLYQKSNQARYDKIHKIKIGIRYINAKSWRY